MPDQSELSGWGAIATYLGVTERSAQEYEKKFGLPVHRMPGPRGRIWALRGEIDAWKHAHDATPRNGFENDEHQQRWTNRRLLRWAALVILPLAVAAGWWLIQRPGPPTSYAISGRTLTVFDDQKRVNWSHQFAHYPATFPPPDYPRVLFSDLDGDGRAETLFVDYALNELGAAIRAGQAELNLFDSSGRLKWRRIIGTPFVTPQGKRYPAAPWTVKTLGKLRMPRADGGLIVVGASQGGSWAYEVEIYTASGSKVATYLHPGWLWSMLITDLNQDGVEEIVLGGVNNGFEERGYGATLVVLDSRRVEGQGSVPPGDTRQAAGLPTGVESAVLRMPDFGSDPNPH
ncbi:MAG: hypothetical protein HZB13_22000, partial [Acidobacteria bacterium]|nr:hypothetical protein [Acidobacteriota bacterium]